MHRYLELFLRIIPLQGYLIYKMGKTNGGNTKFLNGINSISFYLLVICSSLYANLNLTQKIHKLYKADTISFTYIWYFYGLPISCSCFIGNQSTIF